MKITITADDGRIFTGDNYTTLLKQVNTYEAEMKAKKEKEEADRKIREEKEMQLKQINSQKLKAINDILQKACGMVQDFEKETGKKLAYKWDLSKRSLVITECRNTLDFAYDNFYDTLMDLLNER